MLDMISDQKLPRLLNIGLVFPIIFFNGWLIFLLCQYLHPIVSILVTASLIAVLLDYPIAFLEQRGMKRGWAVGLVLLLTLLLLGVLVLVLGPLVFEQLVEFGNHLPNWIAAGKQQLETLDDNILLQKLPINLSLITEQLTQQLYNGLQYLTTQIINVTFDTINSAFNLLLTVVLTIFLVLNGKSLWDGIFCWFPSKWSKQIQSSLRQSFEGYFGGQAIIASILSAVLSLGFLTLQVPFGLLFGLGIGVASLIPLGGFLSITLVGLLVTSQNVWLGVKMLIFSVILGQINENFVAPRLIGKITGLNPAWVLISLLIGVKVGGVLGLLMAVPTASFIKKTADTLHDSSSSVDLST